MNTWTALRKISLVMCMLLVGAGLFCPSALMAVDATPQEQLTQAEGLVLESETLLAQSQQPGLTDAQRDDLQQQALDKAEAAGSLIQQATSALLTLAANVTDPAQAQALYDLAAQGDGILTQIIDIGNTLAAVGINQGIIDTANLLSDAATATQNAISGLQQTLVASGATPGEDEARGLTETTGRGRGGFGAPQRFRHGQSASPI